MAGYSALWCKSSFSFLEGASHPDEYVEEAASLGLSALALTDRDGVYGVVHAHRRAVELGVRLIIGAEVSVDDGTRIVLLAAERIGYANLCRLITRGRLRSDKGASSVTWDEVCAHASGLLALWGGERSALTATVEPLHVAASLEDAFGDRLYAIVARHRRAEETEEEARLRRRATRLGIPIAAAVEVLYHSPPRRPLQDVLTCIRHGTRLTTVGRLTRPNAEHALKSPRAFAELFDDDIPAVARTREIAERCTFTLGELRYRYPSERLPDGKTSSEWLRELTLAGARGRYGEMLPADVRTQIEKELSLIDELDYCGYFLTMHEIVQYCRSREILCQGRGSAANSVVCYCLGITAIDPVRMDLLFERFLSRERAEPPDIDLDIEHERREEVIQSRLRALRPLSRGDGGGSDPLPAALGGARRGQGARARRDFARSARAPAALLRRSVAERAREGRPRPCAAGSRALARALERASGFSAPSLDPPRRLPSRSRAGAATSSRSRTARWKAAR